MSTPSTPSTPNLRTPPTPDTNTLNLSAFIWRECFAEDPQAVARF